MWVDRGLHCHTTQGSGCSHQCFHFSMSSLHVCCWMEQKAWRWRTCFQIPWPGGWQTMFLFIFQCLCSHMGLPKYKWIGTNVKNTFIGDIRHKGKLGFFSGAWTEIRGVWRMVNSFDLYCSKAECVPRNQFPLLEGLWFWGIQSQ